MHSHCSSPVEASDLRSLRCQRPSHYMPDKPTTRQPLQPTQEHNTPYLQLGSSRAAQRSSRSPAALTRGFWFSENPRKVLNRKALAPVHSSTSVFITGCQAVSSTSLHHVGSTVGDCFLTLVYRGTAAPRLANNTLAVVLRAPHWWQAMPCTPPQHTGEYTCQAADMSGCLHPAAHEYVQTCLGAASSLSKQVN